MTGRTSSRCGLGTKHALTFVVIATAGLNAPAFGQEDCERSAIEFSVMGDFLSEDGAGEGAAKDLSGIACESEAGANPLRCIVVNDENVSAQWASISNGQITPGAEIPLIGDSEPEGVLGQAPTTEACSGGHDFGEFDGEAVAYAASTFYVAGSHGCSRNSKEFRLSSFLLARVSGSDAGGSSLVELTYRLADALLAAGPVKDNFGKDLNIVESGVPNAVGLNIEGIAVADGELMAGLRAPSIEGAFIVSAPIADLFAAGAERLATPPSVQQVQLGPDIGIRDMTMLHDGRLLILGGPTLEQPLPYTLTLASSDGAILHTCRLGDVTDDDWKAEGVAEVGAADGALTVLVLFDDPENGAPRGYKLPLP